MTVQGERRVLTSGHLKRALLQSLNKAFEVFGTSAEAQRQYTRSLCD